MRRSSSLWGARGGERGRGGARGRERVAEARRRRPRAPEPVDVVQAPGEPAALYVVEQPGLVRVVERGRVRPTAFLDVRSLVVSGGEQGLLGLVFSPGYARDRTFYVNYTATGDGSTRIVRYRVAERDAPCRAAPKILRVAQPYANHNGGNLEFGPDGKLWVGLGDGGGGRRPREQRAEPGYAARQDVPARRPAGRARPELVGSACATPGGISFDRATGDLWIGDVGQNEVEEVDRRCRAGRRGSSTSAGTSTRGGAASPTKPLRPGQLVQPVAQYTHDDGCSITGGFVYRGKVFPRLDGPLRLRRLLQWDDLEHLGARRRAAQGARARPAAHVVRREPHGRDALRRLRRGPIYRFARRRRSAPCAAPGSPTAGAAGQVPICEDDRQWAPPDGQRWTTAEGVLEARSPDVREHEPGLTGRPARSPSASGSARRDGRGQCAPEHDPRGRRRRGHGRAGARRRRRDRDLASALLRRRERVERGARRRPVLLHAADAEWVTRPDAATEHWEGDVHELPGGPTLSGPAATSRAPRCSTGRRGGRRAARSSRATS